MSCERSGDTEVLHLTIDIIIEIVKGPQNENATNRNWYKPEQPQATTATLDSYLLS